MARQPKLGTGQRFRNLEASFGPGIRNPGALAGEIGRKKYGAKKMAQLSAAGRSHPSTSHVAAVHAENNRRGS